MCLKDLCKAKPSKVGLDDANSGASSSSRVFHFSPMFIDGTLHRVSYMALCLLFLAQLVALLHNHSHLGGLSMFDTVLLLIIKMDTVQLHKWLLPGTNVSDETDIAPFLRTVACTVFEALLFVNFTHAIEAITCADSSSHFSAAFLTTVGLNVIVKAALIFLTQKMSPAYISSSRRYFLHFGPPLVTVSLALVNQYFSPETDQIVSWLDRYLGAGMCVLLFIVALPLFIQNFPFLLCDVPKGAEEEQLRVEIEAKVKIEAKFPNVRLTHVHIYSKWPGHEFDVFLHMFITKLIPSHAAVTSAAGDPTTTTIYSSTGASEEALQRLMHSLQLMLRKRGARRVTIQPWLAVPGEQPQQQQQQQQGDQEEHQHQQGDQGGKEQYHGEFRACVSEKCVRREKSCCKKEVEDEGAMCKGA